MVGRCVAIAGVALVALAVAIAGGCLFVAGMGANRLSEAIPGVRLTLITMSIGAIALMFIADDDNGSWIVVVGAIAGAAFAVFVPNAYLAWTGHPATAAVTAVSPCVGYGTRADILNGDCTGWAGLDDAVTGHDLGWTDCADDLNPGDRVAAVVDPRGWLPPEQPPCLPSPPARVVTLGALLLYLAGPTTLIVRQASNLAATVPIDDDMTTGRPATTRTTTDGQDTDNTTGDDDRPPGERATGRGDHRPPTHRPVGGNGDDGDGTTGTAAGNATADGQGRGWRRKAREAAGGQKGDWR